MANLKTERATEHFYPETKQQWRKWLQKNHESKTGVWVVMYNKQSGKPSISWSDAVDEALCFGWIDSIKRSLNAESAVQYFSKRKPKSTWSKINKEKIKRLTEAGLMADAGLTCIEVAKQNGSWEILDSVEELTLPPDLTVALNAEEKAMDYFLSLSKSTRKAMLQWLVLAKRAETRQQRITEIATKAGMQQKPKQF